jgi:hypothetical protein
VIQITSMTLVKVNLHPHKNNALFIIIGENPYTDSGMIHRIRKCSESDLINDIVMHLKSDGREGEGEGEGEGERGGRGWKKMIRE